MNLINVLLVVYIAVLLILFIYGSNCFILTYLHRKKRNEAPALTSYPAVTVQLPIYNEFYVVERLIRKVTQMDYPKEKLEIQVLDDSTDETTNIAKRCIDELQNRGANIYLIHRTKRDGYKAGALREGLKSAHGEFIAVFDADFLPDINFLKKCIPYFSDPEVGMVQTRWGHINENYSLLTKAISIGIDGHFQIEQNSRHASGLFLNFNGTAGVWRRTTIEAAGGWQDDTLTEDLDLSYRAQLGGWKLVFLDDVVSPAEIPVQINAFKRQQFRWAKGSIQCTKKLLPRVFAADIPVFKKIQAVLHLTYYAVHPLMVLLLLLILPLIFLASSTFSTLFYLNFLAIGTFGPLTMYALSQRELYEDWKSRLKYLPVLTVLGTGISANNTKAVIDGLFNRQGAFQRTPKFGIEKSTDMWEGKKYRLGFPVMTAIEAALGVYALVALYISIKAGSYFLVPFLALYVIGYFYVCGLTILHSIPRSTLILACILCAAAALRLYRAMMGDLSEDPYQHWLISAYLLSGIYADAGTFGPPGYHLLSSGIMLVFGRDMFWLKIVNILFSLGGIYLVYRIADNNRAGLLAASFLALNPFDLLISSTSYTEPMAVFFFLLTIYFLHQNREKAAGTSLLLSAITRYEVWLAFPFLLREKKVKMLHLAAPLAIFVLAWFIYTTANHNFFPGNIIERSQQVLSYEIGKGAVDEGMSWRTARIVEYFFISSPLVYAAGLYFAIRNIKKSGLFAFVLFNLAIVFIGAALGLTVGSFRYFSFSIPLICIFAAAQASENKKLFLVIIASLIIALPFYLNLYSDLNLLYQPVVRAGDFVSSANASGVVSNSPMALYFTGIPAAHIFSASILKNASQEDAINILKEHSVDYVIYVSSPPGELEKVFPGIEYGENVSGLELVYDPNGWEIMYGAKKVYVYRLSDGLFRSTGSYISSSPLIADIDGDGDKEIIAASDMLYVWKRNGSPLSGFPVKTSGLIASTPSVAYTKNGAVIFVGCDDNKLYAWWYNGSLLAGFPKTTDGDVFSKPLILNRYSEVVTGSDDGKVYALYMNASPVEGWPVQTQGYVSSSPIASDLDMDGEPEIIAGSWDTMLYAWHLNGTPLPGFPFKTGDALWATPSVADLEGNGSKDIIAASDMVYAWNSRGEMLSGFPIRTGSYIVSSPLVEDIDLDGKPEIVVASDALYVYNSSGSLKPGWPVYTGYYFWASPRSADLDGDGQKEIVIGDWGGNVYAFKSDGRTLKGFPKHTAGRIFASAAIGSNEIVIGSWDKNIYRWDIENGSYSRDYMKPQKNRKGLPVLNGISVSKEYGVLFLAANFSGDVERPRLYYYGDNDTWHPSPVVLSEGRYVGMIAPQKKAVLKYYISAGSYRFPEVGYYELKN